MANYINTTTGEYPVSERDIREEFYNTSFPNPFVPPNNYAVVFESPRPEYNNLTQFVSEVAPEKTSKGHYEQRFEVVDLDEYIAAANIERHKINHNENIWRQIEQLEKDKQMPRHVRDLIPPDHPARIKADKLEAAITELKGKLL